MITRQEIAWACAAAVACAAIDLAFAQSITRTRDGTLAYSALDYQRDGAPTACGLQFVFVRGSTAVGGSFNVQVVGRTMMVGAKLTVSRVLVTYPLRSEAQTPISAWIEIAEGAVPKFTMLIKPPPEPAALARVIDLDDAESYRVWAEVIALIPQTGFRVGYRLPGQDFDQQVVFETTQVSPAEVQEYQRCASQLASFYR